MEKYFHNITITMCKKKKRNFKENNIIHQTTEKLKLNDINHLLDYQVTVDDLNVISKKHNIKIKGKKEDKLLQCYNMLNLKIHVNNIKYMEILCIL